METLRNHTLIYDSDCPMCDLYTKTFVETGMLDSNGRVEYGCARVPVTFSNERARNEIALVDYDNGTVTYGIDSLIKIIAHSYPRLGKIANWRPVYFIVSVLYSFISYNRKVIAPANVFEKRGSCTPAFHLGYRIAYIIFTWLLTSVILNAYVQTLQPIVPPGSFIRESMVCGGQILFQLVIVLMIAKDKVMHYIGNMMTVSFIGALLLLPMLMLTSIITVNPFVMMMWFGATVTLMLILHLRRTRKLGMRGGATVSWVLYRLIVLCIIMF